MRSVYQFIFIYFASVIILGLHFNIQSAGSGSTTAQPSVAVCRGNLVSIERSASPMACPDQYCSLVKKAVLHATQRNNAPIHVDFGKSLVPVLQTVALRNHGASNSRFAATHQELIITLWTKRLGKLVLDLLGERNISGISITGFTLRDADIFAPMIAYLVQATFNNLQRLGLNYIVSSF